MRIRVAATVVLILLAALVVYLFLTVGFVEELEVEVFRKDDGALVASLVDGGRNPVGGIRVESFYSKDSPNTFLHIGIWHVRGTRLDSLSIAFESSLQFEVFAASDRSPLFELRRSEIGGAVVFSAPDLGFEGRRDVLLEFYVTPTFAEPLELNVSFEISMRHEGILSFHGMEAEASATLMIEEIEQGRPEVASIDLHLT